MTERERVLHVPPSLRQCIEAIQKHSDGELGGPDGDIIPTGEN